MSKISDFDGDGYSEIPVASPWGIGILKLSGNTLDASMMAPNGTRFGNWLLNTADNQFGPVGNFGDKDKVEIFVKSDWGIGFLMFTGNSLTASMMASNGTRLGGWLLDTADNQFGPAGDFDGDGKIELMATSDWGVSFLKRTDHSLSSPMMAPNGTRLGEWLLSTPDNQFGPVGDFDGDGADEILVRSDWGIGILKFEGDTLTTTMLAPNGTRLGEWLLNTSDNQFGPVGDFDGDGIDEILVRSDWGIGILKLAGSSIISPMMAPNGTRLSDWLLNTADNQFGPVGDFDGEGKAGILVRSDWGIGILNLVGNSLTASMMAPNGTHLGKWLLNTADNRFNIQADFDGDGKAEILATSPWGMGILKLSANTLTARIMAPNGTRFGNWHLNTADNDLEIGNWSAHAVIVFHADFTNLASKTASVLKHRGYKVHTTDSGSTGYSLIEQLSLTMQAGDRMIVYLAGHGSNPRIYGDMSKEVCANHHVEFNHQSLSLGHLAPLLKKMGDLFIDLTVIDGSCNGGETVFNAVGEKYCAVATTGVYSPSLTNLPNPADSIKKEGKPSTFGLWWSQTDLMASWVNGATISQAPIRICQRLFRNDSSEIALSSLFFRPAINNLRRLDNGGWSLLTEYCFLYKYIYPDAYNALPVGEQSKFTVDTNSFISGMNEIVDVQRPIIDSFLKFLKDKPLLNKASAVYSESFNVAWRTLANDPEWDPLAAPSKHSEAMYGLAPDTRFGAEGFSTLVSETIINIKLLEVCYEEHERLLREIDGEVLASFFSGHLPPFQTKNFQPHELLTPEDYELYNTHDLELSSRLKEIHDKYKIERPAFDLTLSRLTSRVQTFKRTEAHDIIENDVIVYKQEFLREAATDSELADLVARFKAITVVQSRLVARTSFMLSIVEDSISKVQTMQAGRVNPGDIVFY